ncbi:MAG: Holliday junction branch migration DNA helicase RuvB, partial [Chloroflexota bacterium]
MADNDRMVGGGKRRDDRENIALRPKRLTDIIGQDNIRDNMEIIIEAAQARQEPIDHVLFY